MFPLDPLHNPMGFGPVDYIELAIALMLVGLVMVWRPLLAPVAARFSRRSIWCMIALALAPLALRLILLAHHPVPSPDIYDEFGHLLVADTLRHGRLANPPHPLHQFFETFFVLQQPTYSSIYPIGNGLMLAIGGALFGVPWTGVLLATSAFCALVYWMLRGWTTPGWALFGGILAIFEFGPLNQWTNNYWGGAFSAAAGCLVFGALARLRNRESPRDGILLGLGLALHLLSRPYESVFLLLCVPLVLVPLLRGKRFPRKALLAAALVCLPAVGITLLQNYRVTGHWLQLPYSLSQYQYGVPSALTFQPTPIPHLPLTPQQESDYRMQSNFHPGTDTIASYLARLFYRTRYYRFYFYPPLYLALIAFALGIRSYRQACVPLACLLFALGTNFFPAFQFHYMAAVVCLFVLMSVWGLQKMGKEASRAVVFLCVAWFAFWYAPHLLEGSGFPLDVLRLDAWNSINHRNPERRIEVNRQLSGIPGKLAVLVRYWPQHPFQDEWVYNSADIDGQRIVWARDLGDAEDEKLRHYYPDRKMLLLEPDARPPKLSDWAPAPPPGVETEKPESKKPEQKKPHPLFELEQVR